MCFIITVLAAVVTTMVWYVKSSHHPYKISTLGLMYWGAALMWIVDGFFRMANAEPFFEFSMNDTLLGCTIVISGFLVWGLILVKRLHKSNFK